MSFWKTFLDPDAPAGRYLPWKEVAFSTGLSRTTAWRLQRRGEFPRPYVISPGRVGYLEREIAAWKASCAHRTEQLPERRTLTPLKPSEPVERAAHPARAAPRPQPPGALARAEGAPAKSAQPSTRRLRGRADQRQITFDF